MINERYGEMVLEVGDDDITAVTGVGDDGDDEEVAGGSGDVVASGAPSFLDHELVKFCNMHRNSFFTPEQARARVVLP